jgi:hypothetical protein
MPSANGIRELVINTFTGRWQPVVAVRLCVAVSHREQSVEEVAVAFEGHPKVLGGGLFAAPLLLFEA